MSRTLLLAALLLAGPGAVATAQSAPGVLSLDHVGIQTADLDRSVAFYTRILGLKEVPAPFPKTMARWISLGDGRMLHIVAGGQAGGPKNKWDHFALTSSDLDGMIVWLDHSSVAWSDMGDGRKVVQTRPDGTRQIFLKDPDGYNIEINDGVKSR